MIRAVIDQYLQRFQNTYTESIYNAKGVEDLNYMRRCYDYLECDKSTLTQTRNLPTGLRNIGNTCYLNTILQLLFHVNYLREKVSGAETIPTKLLQKLQFLFGVMAVGKMPFSDPTELFEELRNCYPDVFAPGVQNDFHEVFTLLLDAIGESYKNTAPEDARFIKKLLLGKMMTKIDYQEGKLNKNAQFNIINLESCYGSFNKAFQKWKRYQIAGYTTPNGKVVTASAQNVFIETPALMVFFINRVGFRKGKLEKDSQPFEFDDSILIAKAFQSEKTMAVKALTEEKQKQINEEKTNLINWLEKTEKEVENLQRTIKYLKAKDAPLISNPLVENPLGEEGRVKTLEFLKQQELALEKRCEKVKLQLKELDEKFATMQKEENCERYVLWGAMVHQGTSATFGHYKLCLNLSDEWFEFNDKYVSKITRETVDGYKERGQICCLFYRRPLLVCNNKKIPIPYPLKNAVSKFQKEFKRDIDKARILQMLYQESESLQLLLEVEMKLCSEDKYQLLFKPVHYALNEKYPFDACKGIILQEHLRSQLFISSLQDKLITPFEDTELSFKNFGIHPSYFVVREALFSFLRKEVTVVKLGQAYEELSKVSLVIKNQKCQRVLNQIVEVIILKGIYYLKSLSQFDCSEHEALVFKLSEGLDKLLKKKGDCQFSFVCIAIKASIPLLKGHKKLPTIPHNRHVQDYFEYFSQNFRFWINQRNKFANIDETNYFKDVPPFLKERQNPSFLKKKEVKTPSEWMLNVW